MYSFNTGIKQHTYRDVMQVFLHDFKKDFDLRDVEVFLRTILKEKDVDAIVKTPQPKQIYRLFWTLREQPEEVLEKFVIEGLTDTHELNYGFLKSAIQKECRDPSDLTKMYISAVDRLYNDNQKFAQYNVPRMEPYMKLLKALLLLRPSQNVVVEGVLGAGKQWLVLDVCSSFVVQSKMNFKIFWLNVRDCCSPEDCLEALQLFLFQLSPNMRTNCNQSVQIRIEMVKTELKHILEDKTYKNCLLVLRNVKNKNVWKVFNLGCKILLTTRYKSVANFLSTQTTTHITLNDALTTSETESLFAKYLREKSLEKEIVSTITREQKTNPLQLSIIAENIYDGVYNIDNIKQIKSNKLTSIIEASLNVLDTNDRQLYKILFIFPDSADIPIDLLSLVWSVDEPIMFVNKFYKHSLLKKNLHKRTITLPSIYKELNLSVINEEELNNQILDHYNIPLQFDNNEMSLSLDSYFYSHVGHHLSKLSNGIDRLNLFRKIYLDFRFLDQKIRNDSTPWGARGSILHTLQSLKLYRMQIDDNALVDGLLDFLAKVEEKLIRSKFPYLLQIALMENEGAVYNEALRQALQYPNYVWFTEGGRFHQHRRIINLGKHQVRHALYLDDDFCLMALNTNQLLLIDVSLKGDATYLLSDENDDIIEMHVFNKKMHLLTLHSNGSLKLWSLRQLLQRSLPLSTSLRYDQLVNSEVKRSMSTHLDQKVSSFFLDEKYKDGNMSHIQLHVAYTNGDICICDWENRKEKFMQSHTPILRTHQLKVRCFLMVHDRFYVLCTVNCTLTVWNLNRGSKEAEHKFSDNLALSMETYVDRFEDGSLNTMLLLICKSTVFRLRLKETGNNSINKLHSTPLQLLDRCSPSITCGRLSKDGRYLVLGTDEGLIVYDLKFSDFVLKSNVSEQIVCLDVYDLNHPILKYIVLCGAAGANFLHLYTLRSVPGSDNHVIAWVYSAKDDCAPSRGISCDGYLEPNVNLQPILKMTDNGALFSIDFKSRIHKIQTADEKNYHSAANWFTIKTPQMGSDVHITALYPCNDNTIYAGYNNGKIFNISDNKEIFQDYIFERINYLKVINLKILVASSRQTRKTIILFIIPQKVKKTSQISPIELAVYTKYTRLFEEHFLLLFSEDRVLCLDLVNPKQKFSIKTGMDLVGFDLKHEQLFLAFSDSLIKVYMLETIGDELKISRLCSENIKSQSTVIYLTVSHDGKTLALGAKNGNIMIYTFRNLLLTHIYTIKQGHESGSEMKLRFSPCLQILVSCGDQLCFWNMHHFINNQSQAEMSLKDSEEVFIKQNYVKHPELVRVSAAHKAHIWWNKRGNAMLPELLASLKFVGNKARNFYSNPNFTRFYVVDDEGFFYDFKVLAYSSKNNHGKTAKSLPVRELSNIDRQDVDGIDVVCNVHSDLLQSAINTHADDRMDVT